MAKKSPSAKRVSTEDRQRSALLHAVAKHTAKFANRAHLPPGVYAVKARVTGTVDGMKIAPEALEGTLTVDADSERAGVESADQVLLTAYLLRHIPKGVADKIARELPKTWRGELGAVPDNDVAAAKALLAQLRFEGAAKPVKGAVKFIKAA